MLDRVLYTRLSYHQLSTVNKRQWYLQIILSMLSFGIFFRQFFSRLILGFQHMFLIGNLFMELL